METGVVRGGIESGQPHAKALLVWNAHKTKNHKKSYKILRAAIKKAVRTVVVKPYPGEQKAVNEGVVELNPGSRPVLTEGRAEHQGQHQNCPGKQGDARP